MSSEKNYSYRDARFYNIWRRIFLFIIYHIFYMLRFKMVYRLEVQGRENIPKDNKFIIAANLSITKKSIMAHNIYSWEILRDDFIYVDKNTIMSEDIDYTLKKWLEETSPEKRKIFVDTVFQILYSSEASTFKDIIKNMPKSIPKILKKYVNIPKEDKKVIGEMVGILIKWYAGLFGIRGKIRFDLLRSNKGKK